MSYLLPEDIVKELERRFPETPVTKIVEDALGLIVDTALKHGACSIRGLGQFISFKTYSSKLGLDVLRLKFKLSQSLDKKIKSDDYLIKNAPVKAKVKFTEEHRQKCSSEQKIFNRDASKEALQVGKIKTGEKLAFDEILNSLEEHNE